MFSIKKIQKSLGFFLHRKRTRQLVLLLLTTCDFIGWTEIHPSHVLVPIFRVGTTSKCHSFYFLEQLQRTVIFK